MVPVLSLIGQLFRTTNDPPATRVTTVDVEKSGQQDPLGEVLGDSNELSYDKFQDSHRRTSKLCAQRKEGIDFNGLVPPETRIVSANGPEERNPSYRILPIFSGIMIPFSLLLSIPSLTGHWYIRTVNNVIVESMPNSLLLNLAMGFSTICLVLANVCLVVRFAERYVEQATFLCIVFLLLHDLVNIPVATIFGVIHRFDDVFTYGQPFWMTVCATAVSTVTNITLVIDFYRTSDFSKHGSGLTHKQRSLVIVIIILLTYLALGSLVQAIMLNINFVDALYFSVVSIEAIGFGDIVPVSPGSRVFTCFYLTGGILNLGLLISTSRAALLEGAAVDFQRRIQAIRAGQRRRRVRARWRAAIKWRLQANRVSLWVSHEPDGGAGGKLPHHRPKKWNWPSQVWCWVLQQITRRLDDPSWRFLSGPQNTRLNLEALTKVQLEAAALEAGASLDELLPAGLIPSSSGGRNDDDRNSTTTSNPDKSPHTRTRIGRMSGLVGQLALGFSSSQSSIEQKDSRASTVNDIYDECGIYQPDLALHGEPFGRTMTMEDEAALADALNTEEKNAFHARLSVAFLLFSVFWVAGTLIFMKTENWSFGSAAYFCFISFATVGYGDVAPRTPAGRSIFVVWALLGVGTMTILISILAEAYSAQYQKSIRSQLYPPTAKCNDCSTESPDARQHFGDSQTTVNTYISADTLPLSSPIPISASHSSPTLGRVMSFETPLPKVVNIQQGRSNVIAIQGTNPNANEALPRQVIRHADELRALIAMNLPRCGVSGVYPVHKLPALFSDIEKSLQDITVVAQDALKVMDGQTPRRAL